MLHSLRRPKIIYKICFRSAGQAVPVDPKGPGRGAGQCSPSWSFPHASQKQETQTTKLQNIF